jgi:predicted transglutaminase-like cysteine proteinase
MATRHSLHNNAVRVVLAGLVLLYVGDISASSRTYSFGTTDHYLTQATDYPRWAALATRHAAQSVEIDACIDDATKCPNALKGYREVVLSGRDLSPARKIKLANRFINSRRWNIEPRRDDDWRTLEDFLQFGGDCEDYAIAKYFVLRRLGFAIDDLRIAITWDMRVQDYHAVTVVHLDDSVLVLDVDGPPRRQITDYRFLFSINESGIWDHKAGKRQHTDSHDVIQQGAQQL